MRASIYNPFLDTLGGGERYTMAFSAALQKKGFNVDVQWKNQNIKKDLESKFGMGLEGINFIQDIKRGDGYDLCFWVSDGSVPLLRSRNNILHFQFPFRNVNGKSLFNRMKFFRIDKIICNSYFTKKNIDKEYGVESLVVYPPVDVESIKPLKKENLIISVGRFSQLMQSKHQDILVEVFKKMIKTGLKEWSFVLAGGTEVGVDDYVKMLEKNSKGYPITVEQNIAFKDLKKLYGRAKIFWAATGFGNDENIDPTKVEHFGISVVEAMSGGVVPMVFDSGGHKEIVADGKNGYLWKTKKDLFKKTLSLTGNDHLRKEISGNAALLSKKFSLERFNKNVESLL